MAHITKPLVFYIPDSRGVVRSRFGLGNMKLGPNVFTYSRLPGTPDKVALGVTEFNDRDIDIWKGTCPGATKECQSICYAERPVKEYGDVLQMWLRNSMDQTVPELPEEAKFLRFHVSGDFSSVEYIENWIERLTARPDVTAWGYTRSWRIPALLPALERLRALPNVQLFASMDASTPDDPNRDPLCMTCLMEKGNFQHLVRCPDDCGAHDYTPVKPWRRSWIWRDWNPESQWPVEQRLTLPTCKICGGKGEYEGEFGPKACMPCTVGEIRTEGMNNMTAYDGAPSYVCPEQTGVKTNCVECGYCLKGERHDVTFLEH